MALLANDTFSGESDETFLSAHTPDSGFGGWETNLTEVGSPTFVGAFINSSGVLQLNTSGGTGAYRCTSAVTDSNMRAWVDVQRVTGASQNLPRVIFLVKAPTSGTDYQEGIGFQIDEKTDSPGNIAAISAVRFTANGIIEDSELDGSFAWNNNDSKRIGLILAGTLLTIYEADVGTGASESIIGTFTLGSISTTGLSELDDGFHKGCSIFSLAAVSPLTTNIWKIDEVAIESGIVAQTADIDYEHNVLIPVSESRIVDYEQILTIPVSQPEVVNYEQTAPGVVISQQAIIDIETSILKKLFCTDEIPGTIITTCPVARTIKCIDNP